MINSITEKLSASVRWSSLAAIGTSLPARMTMFMPLLGYVIVYNSTFVDWLKLTETPRHFGQVSDTLAGVAMRINQIYLGLCALGLGTAVLQITCPSEIKAFSSNQKFVESEAAQSTPYSVELAKQRLELNLAGPQHTAARANEILSWHASRPDDASPSPLAVWRLKNDENIRDLFRVLYTALNHSMVAARVSTMLLYFSGFALLAYPSAQVMLAALVFIWRQ